MIRLLIACLTIVSLGYYSGKCYATTEEDVYENPWQYIDEPAQYNVWVKYKNQTFYRRAKSFRDIIKLAAQNPGAIIIYQIPNNQNKKKLINDWGI